MALHAGVRTAPPGGLHHPRQGPAGGRRLDRGLQPRPAPLRAGHALPGRLRASAAHPHRSSAGAGGVTPSVSTSRRTELLLEPSGVAVSGGVVGDVVLPASVDDADPGAGEDAHRVRVVVAAGAGVGVDLGGPGAVVSAVVGEGRDGLAETLVAGPAEMHGVVLAG